MHDADDEDADLFRDAMRGVRRRARPAPLPASRGRPSPRPRQREADERAVVDEMLHGPAPDAGEHVEWRAPGLQDRAFRKLKRGNYRVHAELDLHGLRWEPAREEVDRFLREFRRRDARCVRIIHGKGLRSGREGPVLKQNLVEWLQRRRDVLAFCSARPADGGTGATVILLRRTAL